MNVELNKQAKLSQHFTLGELCKTSVKTADGNIPSHVHIENLRRLCRWLERLRQRYNNTPIIVNSAYRSPQVNKAVRYATTLLDISDESGEDFDELLIEKSAKSIWVHFAVRPEGNRMKIRFIQT